MDFEAVIERLGSFGRFQKVQYALACLTSMCCAWLTICLVYLLNVPDHRCRVPELGQADRWDLNDPIVEATIPQAECQQGPCYKSCVQYVNGTNSTESCTAGYVFDKSEFEDTFASEFNLVCSTYKDVLVTALVQSHLIGVLVGAPVGGILADRFGRKPVLTSALLLMFCSGAGGSISSDPISYWILRFLCGISTSVTFQTAFVLGMEFIGPNDRLHAGIVIEYVYSIGLMSIVPVAMLLRYWRWFTLAISVLPLLGLCSMWFVTESPRWLASVGRHEDAEAVVRRAAKFNGVELPNPLPQEPERAVEMKRESFFGVFKSRSLLPLMLNVMLQWFVIALVYYGLSLGSGNLPGSIYFTSFLNAAAEAVGYAVPHFTLNKLGRRWSHVGGVLLAAVALLSTILLTLFNVTLDWLLIALTMIGKAAITAAFGVVYLWTAELFPTTVRQMAVGAASMTGRVGTLVAPFLADLRKFIPSAFGAALPQLVFGSLSLAAGVAALLLPETLGMELPETLADGERMAARRSKIFRKSAKVASVEEKPTVTQAELGDVIDK